jgi:hypothetical protein
MLLVIDDLLLASGPRLQPHEKAGLLFPKVAGSVMALAG